MSSDIVEISFVDQVVPKITGSNTQALVKDTGQTFNQTGHSFNQVGDIFEGIYNRNEDVFPVFAAIAEQVVPYIAPVPQTQAGLNNQSKTFNQTSHSFNQSGDTFEGIYRRNQDDIPLMTFIFDVSPEISGIADIGASVKAPFSGMILPIGTPFYFLTYP